MTNATNNTATMQTITFTAKRGLTLDDESTSTLWLGRLPKGSEDATKRRDIALSQPMPAIPASIIPSLDHEQLAAFISDSYADYIKRVKVQRLELGSSYAITLPTDPLELAVTMLTTLTEGTRERKELTSKTVTAAINSDAFKAAMAAYCQQHNIAPDAFKRIVLDEFLRGSTRGDYSIAQSRAGMAAKAVAHISTLAATLRQHADQQANAPHARTLELAAQVIANAPVISDDDLI